MKSIAKNLIPVLALAIAASACSSLNSSSGSSGAVRYGENMILDRGEDEEYEIQIFDSGFDRWFATHSRPVDFYSPQHYEAMNRRYVIAWNEKVSTHAFRANTPFEARINYDPTIDYGLEVNYTLYYYFKYIEDVYGRFL